MQGLEKDYFARNVTGISMVEFFWGLGLPLVLDSTFIPLFLKSLGASNTIIGLVPTIYFLNISLFPLFAGILATRPVSKRILVIQAHLIPSSSLALLGIILFFTRSESAAIPLFLAGYALFAAGVGIVFPVWQNYLVNIFAPRRIVSALSVMMIFQSISKLLSSFFIREFVSRYAFSLHESSILLMAAGAFCFTGSFFFLVTRELFHEDPPDPFSAVPKSHSIQVSHRRALLGVLKNRNFLVFLGNELEMAAVTGILAFYATYATGLCGIAPEIAAGLFITFNYIGAILSNLVLGWFNILSIRNKCLLSKGFTFSAIALLLVGSSVPVFLLVSFFLGSARAIRFLIFAPSIKQISGLQDATVYFSLAPLMTLPLSSGVPLLNGRILDSLQHLGAGAYRIVFALMGILVLAALIANLKTDFHGVREDLAEVGKESRPGQL
jgi:MFS family permease